MRILVCGDVFREKQAQRCADHRHFFKKLSNQALLFSLSSNIHSPSSIIADPSISVSGEHNIDSISNNGIYCIFRDRQRSVEAVVSFATAKFSTLVRIF